MTRFDRRTILKLLGASSVGAALPWLSSNSAKAAPGDVPLRMLFIEVSPGCRRTTFEPSVQGPKYVAQTTALPNSAWDFRPVMSSLSPYRSRVTMFENLDMVSNEVDPTPPGNAHFAGLTHMLTAADRYGSTGDLGGGPSIDQAIAQFLNKDGPVTKLPSLEVMADESAGQYSRSTNHHSYSAPGQQVPYLMYIPDIWDRLFPDPLNTDAAEQAAQQARRTSVYNHVKGDYDSLIAKLGGKDKDKVSAMLQYRKDLFDSLGVVNNREANRPDKASIMDPWAALTEGYQQGNINNRLWHVHTELIGRLAAAALHTDTTRVVTMSIQEPPNYEFGYTEGDYGSSDWHDLIHKVSGDQPEITDSAASGTIDELHRVMYSKVAFILDQLAALPETDGQSLLDHTLVFVYSHIGEGSHDLSRLPWMVIGDAHGYLKMGQYIRCPIFDLDSGQITTDDKGSRKWNVRGRAHNDLFVTLANAMGLQINTFGRQGMAESLGIIQEMLA
ncbi:MAG: DUF1552 domain-containing protein [Polyangiaceae bacterium]